MRNEGSTKIIQDDEEGCVCTLAGCTHILSGCTLHNHVRALSAQRGGDGTFQM